MPTPRFIGLDELRRTMGSTSSTECDARNNSVFKPSVKRPRGSKRFTKDMMLEQGGLKMAKSMSEVGKALKEIPEVKPRASAFQLHFMILREMKMNDEAYEAHTSLLFQQVQKTRGV